ncbi:hypothetical protein LTS18_004778 [Coniosporium uncinatum]|uniref:Uncharacterized protein n=1 Tax=Coniosporium uncinatum TaxID=93489 RepID=A0ACC3DBH9_9PEZI|nr:hypothetical protein LTS18_004778 [Coniosporium uncinatum]
MRSQLLFGLAVFSSSAAAVFVGLGALAYDPVCCFACRAAVSSAPLSCSGTGHGGGHSHGAPPTSPECRPADSAFLTTLAYCINANCDAQGVPIWKLEQYWAAQTTGDPSIAPKWNYGATLQQLTTAPDVTYARGATLNVTSLVSSTAYETQRNFMEVFEKMTAQENQYALVLLVIGFVTPIVITVHDKLPLVSAVYEKAKPYIIYPSTIGSYQYHLIYRFGNSGTYEYWLYAAFAVWAFDRLMRLLRLANNGLRKAVVTEVGPNHIRVDVPGLRWAGKPGYYAYAYFPTLNPLRPWENHPFSINSTALFHSRKHSVPAPTSDAEKGSACAAMAQTQAVIDVRTGSAGVTFFIRKSTGVTRLLQKHVSMLALVEGPYSNNPTEAVLKCDRVLLTGGGIGITGLLAWLGAHPNVKLAWSVRESAEVVVRESETVLEGVADKEVVVEERLDVRGLLERDLT